MFQTVFTGFSFFCLFIVTMGEFLVCEWLIRRIAYLGPKRGILYFLKVNLIICYLDKIVFCLPTIKQTLLYILLTVFILDFPVYPFEKKQFSRQSFQHYMFRCRNTQNEKFYKSSVKFRPISKNIYNGFKTTIQKYWYK